MENIKNAPRPRTDLADEGIAVDDPIRVNSESDQKDGTLITRISVDSDADAARLSLPRGHYTTIKFDQDALFDERRTHVAGIIASEGYKMLRGLCPIRSVFTVGLGNRDITPDALGPLTVDRIPITRQVQNYPIKISGLSPGVSAQTGIDCGELIGSWIKLDRPDLIIAVDALAAKSTERLASTVQLSDSGITPGSGVGRHQSEISRRTMATPVISIGVPTVVDSSTLVLCALEAAGIEPDDRLYSMLKDSFYATHTDCDRRVNALAEMLADALTDLFTRCAGNSAPQA